MITNTTRRFWYALLMALAYLFRNKSMRKWFWVPLVIVGIGFLLPQHMIIPVKDATTKSWEDESFWAYPWGTSITHKGIDIFAAKGTDIVSATNGIVVYTYEGGKGGKSVMVLGPKWRFHYYAHMDEIKTVVFKPLKRGAVIGTVGNTGNAIKTPPHLHYAITTPFPYPNLYDSESIQGWKRMFHLDPDIWLR